MTTISTRLQDLLRSTLVCSRVGLAAFVACVLSIVLTDINHGMVTIWLANAFILAAIYRLEYAQRTPLIIAGCFGCLIAYLLTGSSLQVAIVSTVAKGIELLCASMLIRKPVITTGIENTQRFGKCIFLCSLLTPLCSAVLSALYLSSFLRHSFQREFLSEYIGDALGIIILFPTLLTLKTHDFIELFRKNKIVETAMILVFSSLITLAVFMQSRYPLLFITVPLPLIAAIRLGLVGTMLVSVLITMIGTGATMLGFGPMMLIEKSSFYTSNFILQGYFAVVVLTALPFSVILMQRDQILRDLYKRKYEDKKAQRRIFLGEASRIFQSYINVETSLDNIANYAIPMLGEFCLIVLFDEESVVIGSSDDDVKSLMRMFNREKIITEMGIEKIFMNSKAVRSYTENDVYIKKDHYVLSVPIFGANDEILGIVQVATEREDYSDSDVTLTQEFAERLALAIGVTRLYQRERALANELQRAMLPPFLPQCPGLAIDAVYLAPSGDTDVGGDWYDIYPLPDGRIFLSVGDVCGHGLAAAGEMGKARAVLRALIHVNPDLQFAARHLDELIRKGKTPTITAVLALIDLGNGTITYLSAGHPPLMLAAEGVVQVLDGGKTLPLGLIDSRPMVIDTAKIHPGTFIVAYTDGLIENTRDILEGEQLLIEALCHLTQKSDVSRPAEEIRTAVLGDAELRDDTAIVVLTVSPVQDRMEMTIAATPESVRALRHRVVEFASSHSILPDDLLCLEIGVGEALGNVLDHAYGTGEGEVTIQCWCEESTVNVQIADYGAWREERHEDRGQGLNIIKEFCNESEIRRDVRGTIVTLRVKK